MALSTRNKECSPVSPSQSQTIFQLVRKVLDQLKADVVESHGSKADATITAALPALRESYNNLTDPKRKPVDYAPPEVRFAYVYCYVGAHSDFVYQVLNRTEDVLGNELASRKKIVVTALGGGPGSDLVGLIQYLVEHEDCELETLTCYLCDREQAWADCWTEIGEEVSADFHLNVNFQPLDVTDPGSWAKQKKFLSADFFLLVYFASEVASLGDKAAEFWTELTARSKPGALMVVIDNNSDFFTDFIKANLIGDKWDVLQTEAKKLTPSYQEQKTDLGDHLTRYGAQPRLTGNIVYWVLKRKA